MEWGCSKLKEHFNSSTLLINLKISESISRLVRNIVDTIIVIRKLKNIRVYLQKETYISFIVIVNLYWWCYQT